MSISFSTNIASLRLGKNLSATSSQLSSMFERLSRGTRIAKASDDPSGLALADKLNNDSRIMTVALRNANDILAITNITDAALGEIDNILNRMSELSIQGASSAYTTTQRSAMQLEFSALGSEIDRITATTTFNSINLLSNSSDLVAQIGISNDANGQLSVPSAIATLTALGLGSGTTLTYSLTGTSTTYAVSASRSAYSAIQAALSNVSLQRGSVGAISSRLTVAIGSLGLMRDSTVEAEASVRDLDIASSITTLVRLQVLQQSQTSLLAQANQLPSQVLTLLR